MKTTEVLIVISSTFLFVCGQSSKCSLRPDRGNCLVRPGTTNSKTKFMFYYNTEARICHLFRYSGCGGNENRFLTRKDCETACVSQAELNDQTKTVPATNIGDKGPVGCFESKLEGHKCNTSDSSQRFYWNEEKFDCLAFTYKGCDGNMNNFENKEFCLDQCLPLDGPTCLGNVKPLPNMMADSCRNFVCPPTHVCTAGPFFSQCCPTETEDEGTCPDGRLPFFYPHVNGILFADKCEDIECPSGHKCIQGKLFAKCCSTDQTTTTTATTVSTKTTVRNPKRTSSTNVPRMCRYKPKTGNCNNTVLEWYYNYKYKNCFRFFYSGCGGSPNRFISKADCQRTCVLGTGRRARIRRNSEFSFVPTNACDLPQSPGNCTADIQRWYWNKHFGICMVFRYTGCSWNENNFDNRLECEHMCQYGRRWNHCRFEIGTEASILSPSKVRSCAAVKCPNGYTCVQRSPTLPTCCRADIEYGFSRRFIIGDRENYFKCPGGVEPYKTDNAPVLAASCTDIKCPQNHYCVNWPSIAKCCPKIKGQKESNFGTFDFST